jgi:hypothetical protein
MSKLLRLSAAALALMFAMGASAAKFFALGEVFSNADGSVQFIQMNTVDSGALQGVVLVATDGTGSSREYAFPNDLVGNVINRSFLVATQGFADLGVLQPDFVVPNGFLFRPRGSVEIIGNDVAPNEFPYQALPTDGMHALWANGDIHRTDYSRAFARNSRGQSYLFPSLPATVFGFGGLWWNAPAGSESGWGMAVERQGATVFAVWATYDGDGSPLWFVIQANHVERGIYLLDYPGPNLHEGTLYRMSGPAFGTDPFETSKVSATPVATAGFHFDVAGDSFFYYGASRLDPNGGDRTTYKIITHQVFASPLPVCTYGNAPLGHLSNFQGMWWNPSESGWGLYVAQQGDVIFALWFTYDANGHATWFAMTAPKVDATTYSGPIFRTTGPAYTETAFDPARVTEVVVGTGALSFNDIDNGTFSYAVGDLTHSGPITRQIFASPREICE